MKIKIFTIAILSLLSMNTLAYVICGTSSVNAEDAVKHLNDDIRKYLDGKHSAPVFYNDSRTGNTFVCVSNY